MGVLLDAPSSPAPPACFPHGVISLDGIDLLVAVTVRRYAQEVRGMEPCAAAGAAAVAVGLAVLQERALAWTVAFAGAFRILGTA